MNKDKIKKVLDAAFTTENASFRMRAALALASLSKIGFNEDCSNLEKDRLYYVGKLIEGENVYFLKLDMWYKDDHIDEMFQLETGKVFLCVCINVHDNLVKTVCTNKYFKDRVKADEFIRQINILNKGRDEYFLEEKYCYSKDLSLMVRMD